VISDLRTVEFPVGDGSGLTAVRVLIDRGGDRALVYYWFQQRGHRLASEYAMKWRLLQDAVLRNRTDGALVRVVTDLAPNEDLRAADERLVRFVRAAAPRLGAFVPD
jgi:EpsI family protein